MGFGFSKKFKLCSTERRKWRSRKETARVGGKRNYILFVERKHELVLWKGEEEDRKNVKFSYCINHHFLGLFLGEEEKDRRKGNWFCERVLDWWIIGRLNNINFYGLIINMNLVFKRRKKTFWFILIWVYFGFDCWIFVKLMKMKGKRK